MLFNKRQRAIIWQAILFSEHTYKRRGNVNAAATVQTVINETEKIFGFDKPHFTKEEVDDIVAGVINEDKAHIQDAFRKGAEVAKEKINEAYNAGFKRCIEELEKRAEKDEKIKLEKEDVHYKRAPLKHYSLSYLLHKVIIGRSCTRSTRAVGKHSATFIHSSKC